MNIIIDFTSNPPVISGHIGQTSHVITDEEIKAFGLDNKEQFKDYIAKVHGKRPDKLWYKNPTKPSDRESMYNDFNWKQITAELTFNSGRVLSTNKKPLIVTFTNYENKLNHPITCTANLSKTVEESVTHSSSNSDTISTSLSFEIEIKHFFKIGTNISYSHTWNQTTTKTHSETITSGAGTSFILEPGESAVAELICNEVTTEVELLYNANLSGYMAYEYNDWYNGHKKYARPLPSANTHKTTKEIVTLKGYTNYKVVVSKANANNILCEYPVDTGLLMAPDEEKDQEQHNT